MKIKINGNELGTRTVRTQSCPAGTAYWKIEYLHSDGSVIYTIGSDAIYGQPSPLAALDWSHEVFPRIFENGMWKRELHREALLRALEQVIL